MLFNSEESIFSYRTQKYIGDVDALLMGGDRAVPTDRYNSITTQTKCWKYYNDYKQTVKIAKRMCLLFVAYQFWIAFQKVIINSLPFIFHLKKISVYQSLCSHSQKSEALITIHFSI